MKRGVLEELFPCALHPTMRRGSDAVMELSHQARFADSRFADHKYELTFTLARAFPTAEQKPQLLITANERCESARRRQPPSNSGRSQDSIELDRVSNTFEFLRPALFNHKQTRNKAVSRGSQQHSIRSGRGLHSRGDVGYFPEDIDVLRGARSNY